MNDSSDCGDKQDAHLQGIVPGQRQKRTEDISHGLIVPKHVEDVFAEPLADTGQENEVFGKGSVASNAENALEDFRNAEGT